MLDSRISDIWLKTLKTEDYELYLHSPFCVKGCKYCVYTGKLITDKDYKDVYRTYIEARKQWCKSLLDWNNSTPLCRYIDGRYNSGIKPNQAILDIFRLNLTYFPW